MDVSIDKPSNFSFTRRRVLGGIATAAAGIGIPGLALRAAANEATSPLPDLPAPATSGIDHIVVVTMPAAALRGPGGFAGFGDRESPLRRELAQHGTRCDRYFSACNGGAVANRMYLHAGQTDRDVHGDAPSELPTIWERLAASGQRGRYYFSDVPMTALFGNKLLGISRPYRHFLDDAARGSLPALAYIDPPLLAAKQRDAQTFLSEVHAALCRSPQWNRTLLIVAADTRASVFDHVESPLAPVSTAEAGATGNGGRLGGRAALYLIGPRARRGHVDPRGYDPNSILNLVAWRFGLEGLGARAESSVNLAHALDFERAPHAGAPVLMARADGAPRPELHAVSADWTAMKHVALRAGFPPLA